MIDLHVHIMPEVDDGSDGIEESIAMAEIAIDGGTHDIVVTPHSNQGGRFENFISKPLIDAFENLEKKIGEQNLPIQLYRGMEIMASSDIVEKMKLGKVISLNDSRYYLIEFLFTENAENMKTVLESVLRLGKIPLIAHPERYECIKKEPALLYEFMSLGCCSQINKGSILGNFGSTTQKIAETLIKNDLITCIASDAHSSLSRTPFMGDIKNFITEQYGEDYAKKLLCDNPRAILEDKDIPFTGKVPVKEKKKKRFLWFR